MGPSRRLWCRQASAAALAALAPARPSRAAMPSRTFILGGGRFREDAAGPLRHVLTRLDTQTGLSEFIPAPYLPHGLVFDAERSGLAFAFEKIGPGAGVVDVRTMRWVAPIAPVGGRLFYGHGAVTRDGRHLLSTETAPDEQGAIGVRDARTLQHIADFPTYGLHPHDCMLADDGKVLVVTNGGGTSASGARASVCYIDVASQRLLERIEMPDIRFNAGHLAPLDRRESVVVSAPRRGLDARELGAVSLQRRGRATLQVVTQPPDLVSRLQGEALSIVVVPERGLFVVTHPTPGLLTIWNLRTGALLKSVDVPRVRGLVGSADGQGVWVSYDQQGLVGWLDLQTLAMDSARVIGGSRISGSHLASWSPATTRPG